MEGRNNMGLLQNERLPCSSSSLEVLDSLWVSNSSPPPPFHVSRIVNFSEATQEENTRKRGKPLFYPNLDKEEEEEENGNENYDDSCFHHHHHPQQQPPEKKRRLSANQVHFLEKSFEVENKLEPERKAQLAKELGLQPRQVAIWFQNRRARYKTKLLEKDYDSLKSSYDQLNSNYDSLFKDNEILKIELKLLTEKLLQREKGKDKSETCDLLPNGSAVVSPKVVAGNSVIKQEDAASSAKSDVFDSSDSPPHCCTDGNNHSSDVFEPELSDFSQDEDDHNNLSNSLLQFPKLEYECYDHELQPSSCHLGFSIEDQSAWFWAC